MKLSMEQELLIKSVRDFSEREIKPIAEDYDKTGDYPKDLVDKLRKSGLLGCIFPEEYGGSDIDFLTYVMLIEEMTKYDMSTAMIVGGTNSLTGPLFEYGSDYQKERYLRRVCEEGMILGFAITEPDAGSDPSNLQTMAVLDGEEWVINGTKSFISHAGIADAYIVMVRTDKTKGIHGISALLVDADLEGLSLGTYEDKMGIRGSHTGELVFRDVRVPKENLLGNEGDGFKIAMHTLDGGRISVGAQSLGIGQRALDEAVKYSKERVQFGKPLCKHQGIAFMLAEMATRLHAARLMTYDAASRKENGEPYTKEAAMAKYFASEAANFVANKAVQIHGGYGYLKDFIVERLYRDAKVLEIFEGTTEVQKIVISKNILQGK